MYSLCSWRPNVEEQRGECKLISKITCGRRQAASGSGAAKTANAVKIPVKPARQLKRTVSSDMRRDERWWPRTIVLSPCSGEPGFSVVGSFSISGKLGFPFGLHQGILIGVTGYSVMMIRNFNRLQSTFTTRVRWPMR
jgi:hypothetical protein